MITLGKKIYLEKGKHRLHERINALLVVTESIGIAVSCFKLGKADLTVGGRAIFECIQLDMQLAIGPCMGAVEAANKDTTMDRIELDFQARSTPPNPATATAGFQKTIVQSVSAFFGEFFEAYKDWVESQIGKDPYTWPSVWNFGRVIRNSGAHNGVIYFVNPKANPVRWQNLEYGPTDNGRPVLFNDMAVGDFIALMLEMSEVLDKLKCPII